MTVEEETVDELFENIELIEVVREEVRRLCLEHHIGAVSSTTLKSTMLYNAELDIIKFNEDEIIDTWRETLNVCYDLDLRRYVEEIFGHELGHRKKYREIDEDLLEFIEKVAATDFYVVVAFGITAEYYAEKFNPIEIKEVKDCIYKGGTIAIIEGKKLAKYILRARAGPLSEVILVTLSYMVPESELRIHFPEHADILIKMRKVLERIEHADDTVKLVPEIIVLMKKLRKK